MAQPSRPEFVRTTLLVLLLVVGWRGLADGAPLRAAAPPAQDCLNYLRTGDGRDIVDWRDTVTVEHCDRMKRLWRLSSFAAYGSAPQFFDGIIGAGQLPSTIGVAMPLLRVVFPERVFFDTDRSELRPEAMEVVQIVARNLQMEPPDVVLFVAGHADARGDSNYNMALSIDRANAIAEAIALQGINVASVWRIGFGEDMPLVPGDTLEAYGQNRRVEFLFAGREEVVAAWLAGEQLDMLCQARTRALSQRCKESLNLSRDYSAVRVTTVVQRIEPSTGETSVGPSQTRLVINPTRPDRITINPVNNTYSRTSESAGTP